jgi:hypothetical protein
MRGELAEARDGSLEPHVYQRGFKQFRNLCVGMPTVDSGEHSQVRPVEASDQQVASGVDQLARSNLAKTPKGGRFLHPGKGLVAFHAAIVDHHVRESAPFSPAESLDRFDV